MTQRSHKKVFKKIKVKPVKLRKYIKHNSPKVRSCGKTNKKCGLSGATRRVIHKYGLNVSRQAFRQIAKNIS